MKNVESFSFSLLQCKLPFPIFFLTNTKIIPIKTIFFLTNTKMIQVKTKYDTKWNEFFSAREGKARSKCVAHI